MICLIRTVLASWCRLAKGGLLVGSKSEVFWIFSDPTPYTRYLPRLPRALGFFRAGSTGQELNPSPCRL